MKVSAFSVLCDLCVQTAPRLHGKDFKSTRITTRAPAEFRTDRERYAQNWIAELRGLPSPLFYTCAKRLSEGETAQVVADGLFKQPDRAYPNLYLPNLLVLQALDDLFTF